LTLRLGEWELVLEGVSSSLATRLQERWGGFARSGGTERPRLRIRCSERPGDESGLGLGEWEPGETYRLESRMLNGTPVVRSYNFCMCPDLDEDRCWKLVLGGASGEPRDRTVENAVRSLTARIALEEGGFALHGAGIRKEGATWIFAGVSGAGKSTAVRLSSPCEELGDDFAVLVPGAAGWRTLAAPFDNRERAPADPMQGTIPLAGVWRLFQSREIRTEQPATLQGVASLLTCVMLPGLFPELEPNLLGNVERFVMEGFFGHLYFRNDSGFLDHLRERHLGKGGTGDG